MNKVLCRTLFSALLLLAHHTQADCVGDTTAKDAQQDYRKAQQLEAEGKDYEALYTYNLAQGYACDTGGNPVAKDAATKAAALGLKRGAQAEQQKNYYSDKKRNPGAFQWYEQGGHYAAADRSLVAALKADPHNINLSAEAQRHFQTRGEQYFSSNNKLTISITGPYTLDESQYEYVKSLPSANIKRLLAEATERLPDAYLKEFAQLYQQRTAAKPSDIAANIELQQKAGKFQQKWQSDRLEDALDRYSDAWSWTQQIADHVEADKYRAQINSARTSHGDRLMASYAAVPEIFESALSAYYTSNAEDKINSSKKLAEKIADQSFAEKKYEQAAHYYQIADNYEKENLANQKLQEEQDKLAENMSSGYAAQAAEMQKLYSDPEKIRQLQEQAMEMQRQMEQQQSGNAEFDAETDDMAEELGL